MPVSGAQQQIPNQGMQRMHPPPNPGYRHPSMPGPTEQYPSYYQSNEQPQAPSYQAPTGGYNQQYQPQEATPVKKVFDMPEKCVRAVCKMSINIFGFCARLIQTWR